jgi:hypothetical protein
LFLVVVCVFVWVVVVCRLICFFVVGWCLVVWVCVCGGVFGGVLFCLFFDVNLGGVGVCWVVGGVLGGLCFFVGWLFFWGVCVLGLWCWFGCLVFLVVKGF